MRPCLILLAIIPTALAAQMPEPPIEDNSFLIEEAYNQEAGVVQHINLFQRASRGGAWAYAFTQEWPIGGFRHQLSYTVPIEQAGAGTAFGDFALNYRFTLYANDTMGLAVAPRISMLLPTGSRAKGTSYGVVGRQVNLPVSLRIHPRVVTHWNAGVTLYPDASDGIDTADVANVNLGQSFVFLLAPTVNLLLETVWGRDEVIIGPGQVAAAKSLFISPGIRFAINFPSGLQIVPGLAVPIGVGPSRGETGFVAYLSLEHYFKR